LPGNFSCIILAAAFILLVPGEKCRHALDRFVTHFVAIGQTCRPSHSAANALLARFLRRQAAFAMLLTQF
jgi:hypothetical protein